MAGVREDDDFVADINVTPFVDVMLVLLVIFMVTAPMMTEGLDVELPQVQAAEVLPTEDDHMILSIKNDGLLFLDECPTTLDDLDSVLKHAVALPEKQLFLRADKQVSYGAVMEVMGRVRAAGITNLGMMAESQPSAASDSDSRAPTGPDPAAGAIAQRAAPCLFCSPCSCTAPLWRPASFYRTAASRRRRRSTAFPSRNSLRLRHPARQSCRRIPAPWSRRFSSWRSRHRKRLSYRPRLLQNRSRSFSPSRRR